MTFTSIGPSGGIVYPFLIVWFRGGACTEFDQRLLQRLPQLLEPLSAPTGEYVVISGGGMPGPTGVLGVGLGIAVAVTCVVWIVRHHNRREHPAEQLTVKPA